MSIPINELVFAGDWSVAKPYPQFQFVRSPIDGLSYVNVGIQPSLGGPDPSVQPSTVWVLFNIPSGDFPPAYGSFSCSLTQLIANAPVKTQLLYTTNDIPAVGVSSATTSPYITVANAGTYKVLSSVQLDKTGLGNAPVDMWIEIENVAVPNSASKMNINLSQEDIITIEWFVQCGAGERISIVVYDPTASGNLRALAVPASPPCPAIPSIITTILRIA